MRKLTTLFAGLALVLACLPSFGQAVVPARTNTLTTNDGLRVDKVLDGVPTAARTLKNFAARAANIRYGNVDQLSVINCGDSFTGLVFKWIFGSPNAGQGATPIANELGVSTQGGWITYNIFTGGANLTSVAPNNAYWGKGQYWQIPAGGNIQSGNAGAPYAGNEFAVYPIIDTGGGTATATLKDGANSATYATISGFSTAGTRGAAKLGFFIAQMTLSGLVAGDTYTLTYAGQTTGNITYSATAATNVTNISAALSALTVGASLSGLVTVTNPSAGVYQLVVASPGTGQVPSRPHITWTKVSSASGAATFAPVSCYLNLASTSGTVNAVPVALGINRVQSCVTLAAFSFAGTQMSAVVSNAGTTASGINQSIFNTVVGDYAPDFLTLDQYAGQADSKNTLQAYFSMFRAALPATTTDFLWNGFRVGAGVTDAQVQVQIGWAKSLLSAYDIKYSDGTLVWPTYAQVAALGTFYSGDTLHFGDGYNQPQASNVMRQYGLFTLANGFSGQDVYTANGTFSNGLSIGASSTAGGPNILTLSGNGSDAIIGAGRSLYFQGLDGTLRGEISNGIFHQTWLQSLGLGSATGPSLSASGANILMSGTGAFQPPNIATPQITLQGAASIPLWVLSGNGASLLKVDSGGNMIFGGLGNGSGVAGKFDFTNGRWLTTGGIGAPMTTPSTTTTTPSTVTQWMHVYDASGAAIGFVPVYNITP